MKFVEGRRFFEGRTISEAIQQAQEKSSKITAGEIEKIIANFSFFKFEYMKSVHEIIMRRRLSIEDAKSLRADAKSQIDGFETSIFDKNFGIAYIHENLANAAIADRQRKMLDSLSPEEQTLLAACQLTNHAMPQCKEILRRMVR